MKKQILFLPFILFLFISTTIFATDYSDAWKAIEANDYKGAEKLFRKSIANGEKVAESYVSLVMLRGTVNDSEVTTESFLKYYDKVENSAPYLYSLWFYNEMVGDYGLKNSDQMELLKKIMEDDKQSGTMKAVAKYQLSQHAYSKTDAAGLKAQWNDMGGIDKWLVTGTFDNYMGSGFEKDYAPVSSPQTSSKFTSKNGTEISWFDISPYTSKSWIHLTNYFYGNSSGIVYMQTFINSPKEQEVNFALGCAGSAKLWVNDRLCYKNYEERVTEADVYSIKYKLNKGYNRILIQLGTDGNASPNMLLRIVDDQFNPIEGLEATQEVQSYQKDTGKYDEGMEIKHFAEAFFENKIKEDKNDLVNYLLLSNCYLRRDDPIEAREVMEKALAISPDNVLLHFELLDVYSENGDREEVLKEIEWLRKKHADLPGVMVYNIKEFMEDENFDEAGELMKKYEKLNGETTELMELKIGLLGSKKLIDELLALVEKAYKKEPNHFTFLNMKYIVETEIKKDFSKGDKLIEKYLDYDFDYGPTTTLISNYLEREKPQKAVKWIDRLEKMHPNNINVLSKLANYAMYVQDYDKALSYNKKALELSPFSDDLWQSRGFIYDYVKKKKEAKQAYENTLKYDPLNYDVRLKLREMNDEDNLKDYFPQHDEYKIISKNPADEGDNIEDYKYLLIENSTIIYDDNASEKYITYVVRINTSTGVDNWKETTLGMNSHRQRFVLEKAEVVKSNGQKLDGETSYNRVVFTDLEPGDAIVIRYKLENYFRGKFAEYYWDDFVLNSYKPIQKSICNVLLANNKKITHKILNKNIDVKESVNKKGNFNLYTWETNNPQKVNSEPYMPRSSEVLTTLHFSTVSDWNKIADWYNDMSEKQAKADYDIKKITKEVVEGKTTEFDKAKAIYEYITDNVSYSSVSFRQSGLVPQLAYRTLKSKLGDCKDVSTLFATMAREENIDVNLVLVSTRDNGLNEAAMPSLNFNHCIVKTNLDNKDYYLELTDEYLPFGTLPSNLLNAQILEIPFDKNERKTADIENLKTDNRVKDKIIRNTLVKITGSDLALDIKTTKEGRNAASTRYHYRDITKERLFDDFKQSISNRFTKQVSMKDIKFDNLRDMSAPVNYNYSFDVKGEVTKLGSLKSLKVPFTDLILTSKILFEDDRKHGFAYNFYEDTDEYVEEMTIELETGKAFIELPESKEISHGKMKYSITFEKLAENKLKISRKFISERREFSLAEYKEMKPFLSQLIELENTHVVFK